MCACSYWMESEQLNGGLPPGWVRDFNGVLSGCGPAVHTALNLLAKRDVALGLVPVLLLFGLSQRLAGDTVVLIGLPRGLVPAVLLLGLLLEVVPLLVARPGKRIALILLAEITSGTLWQGIIALVKITLIKSLLFVPNSVA